METSRNVMAGGSRTCVTRLPCGSNATAVTGSSPPPGADGRTQGAGPASKARSYNQSELRLTYQPG